MDSVVFLLFKNTLYLIEKLQQVIKASSIEFVEPSVLGTTKKPGTLQYFHVDLLFLGFV